MPIGRSAAVGGGWSLKLVKVKIGGVEVLDSSVSYPSRGKKFVVVDLEWTYTGQGESNLLLNGVRLHAVGASSYKYSTKISCLPLFAGPDALQTVFAGGKLVGRECFEIQPADANSVVMFSQSSSGYVFFDLR